MSKKSKRKAKKHQPEYINEELDYLEDGQDDVLPSTPNFEETTENTPAHLVPLMNKEEVNVLVQESLTSKAIQEVVTPRPVDSYPTYTFEEVAALLANNYRPDDFKYIRH